MRVLILSLACLASGFLSGQDLTVYDDGLQNGFEDWSWATHDLSNPDPVAEGSLSISMEPDGWEGLFFHRTSPLAVSEYNGLRFWLHGGPTGGQAFRVYLRLDEAILGELDLAPIAAGVWEQRTINLVDMGITSGSYDGIIFQDHSGVDQGVLFLDWVELLENDDPPPPPTPIAITVDPALDRRAVNPLIYGANFGEASQLSDPGFPLRRWGGNSTTRYNWRFDISNKAFDWFFFNIPEAVANPDQLPHGSSADVFVDEIQAAGAEAILTTPMIGWAPVDDRVKKWSFSEATYGPQLLTECTYFGSSPPPWCEPDAGNGACNPAVNTTGFCSSDGEIVGNDPMETSQPIGPSWVTEWMAHIASRVGTAAEGGPRFWALDNEPMLWDSTHRDIAPTPLTYDEIWTRTVTYASAIKAQDPDALILGPDLWGWCGYFSSASDAAFPNGSCVDGPDRQAHGGLAFIPWYLEQVCQYEVDNGIRLVDYLDIHAYPQGGVSGLDPGSSGEDPTTSARRLRSLKELWDPAYTSESWIGEPMYLIPRLRSWIDNHCPGLGLAITEYKWGPDDGPSGILAQAELLAIFGREGVDLGARWVAPAVGSRAEDAYRLYLNYDGAGATVSGHSVRAVSGDSDAVGAYAIHRDDDRLFLLLFNKDIGSREASLTLSGTFTGGADLYRFDGATPLAFVETLTPTGSSLTVVLPPRSSTLVVAQLDSALDSIFADGFESGDTTAWSSASS